MVFAEETNNSCSKARAVQPCGRVKRLLSKACYTSSDASISCLNEHGNENLLFVLDFPLELVANTLFTVYLRVANTKFSLLA